MVVILGMDWTRSHLDSPEVEEFPQFPEVPLDDVERILSDCFIQQASEYEVQEQPTPAGPASVSSLGYCSELSGSENILGNCEEFKADEMGQTLPNHQ